MQAPLQNQFVFIRDNSCSSEIAMQSYASFVGETSKKGFLGVDLTEV